MLQNKTGAGTAKVGEPTKRKKNPIRKGKKGMPVGPGDVNMDSGTPAKGIKGSSAYKGLMSTLRGRG